MANVTGSRKEAYGKLDPVIEKWKDEQGGLLPIMQNAQEVVGCIDEDCADYLSSKLGVPVSTIYGVATFYSQFTLEPKGKYTFAMCMGTACYVRGAQDVMDELEKQMKVAPGKTDDEGFFTLEATRCIGCCGLAPAMMVNDEVYGRLVPADIKGIVEKYRAQG